MSCNEILVSVCCMTYNHVSFIRQCLDGFMMQKCSFSFEVLIHDDASTDGTQDIIREYVTRYPNIIKPIYQKENQYSKGIDPNVKYNFSRAKGKYIAMCEGDDYWTDPYKLQKQVDFLESHPDYVMCSHRFNQYIQEKNVLEEEDDLTFQGVNYDLENLIGSKWLTETLQGTSYDLRNLTGCKWITQTLTVMYRRDALDVELLNLYGMSQDVLLFYALLKQGKGYCFPDVMGVYRVHGNGVWSGISLNKQRMLEFRQRLAIYRVEQSEDAAFFLLGLFRRAMSRIWMMKHYKMFFISIKILSRHFGFMFTMKLLFWRLFFNRGITWEKVTEMYMRNK